MNLIRKENWKRLFRDVILERGFIYYQEDRVCMIEESDAEVIAEVEGSDTYDVAIGFDGNMIDYMRCSCPHAMDGNYCKHMAAVLYQHFYNNESGDNSSGLNNFDNEKEEIETLLSKIPGEDKYQLLYNMLHNDPNLKNTLKVKYGFEMNDKIMRQFEKELENIVDSHSDRSGFIDWRHANDFGIALGVFMDKRICVLIDKKYVMQALRLTNQIMQIISDVDIDDDGDTSMVAEECYHLWERIYEVADDNERKEIRNFFFSYKEGTLIDYIEEYLYEFRENVFSAKEDIEKLIKELDNKLVYYGDSRECGYIFSPFSGHVSVIDKRVQLMKKIGASDEEVNAFLDQHRQFTAVRTREIDNAIDKEDYERAIGVLLESRELDKDVPKLVNSYTHQLIDLYKRTGNTEGIIKELKYSLLNFREDDRNLFRELKSYIDDKKEWDRLAQEIITANSGNASVYEYLMEEEKYDEMMDKLDRSYNCCAMDEYFDILSEKVPHRVIQFYMSYVIKEIEIASNRNMYHKLVLDLRKMCFNEQGRNCAQIIADNWRKEYKRKRLLIDELDHSGF